MGGGRWQARREDATGATAGFYRDKEGRGGGAETEGGFRRMRGDLQERRPSSDLSTDAQQGAQETVPSDRVATPLTDE